MILRYSVDEILNVVLNDDDVDKNNTEYAADSELQPRVKRIY